MGIKNDMEMACFLMDQPNLQQKCLHCRFLQRSTQILELTAQSGRCLGIKKWRVPSRSLLVEDFTELTCELLTLVAHSVVKRIVELDDMIGHGLICFIG